MKNINCGLAVCRLIGNVINSKNTAAKESLPSISDMAAFAEKHNLLTMLYCALKHCGYSENELSAIAKRADEIAFYQIKTDALAFRLSGRFSNAEIPHMIVKGIEYHKYYPSYLIRKTSDADFFITPEHSENAEKIITSLGFEKTDTTDSTITFSKKPCYHIELHKCFTLDNSVQNQVIGEILSNFAVQNNYRKSLTATGNLIFALLHLYKHISTSGAGARMFLDIYLIQKSTDIDKSKLSELIKRLGFQRFYTAVTDIANYLFEGGELDESLLKAVEFIFNSGAFGNEAIYHKLKVSRLEGSHKKRVYKHFTDEFGFSSENIKRKYPMAKKHPATIPYYQVYRIVSGLVHKKSTISDINNRCKTFKDKKSVNEVSSIMKSLGIGDEK